MAISRQLGTGIDFVILARAAAESSFPGNFETKVTCGRAAVCSGAEGRIAYLSTNDMKVTRNSLRNEVQTGPRDLQKILFECELLCPVVARDLRRLYCYFRLRSYSHAFLPADHHGLVPEGPETRHAADSSPLLLARSL
jgi:hypothetical protein